MQQLLTDALRAELPALYATEGQGNAGAGHGRFFTPDSNWAWYAVEFDGEDLFFGLVDGQAVEPGYFSLSELTEARGPYGLPIERDEHWEPRSLGDVRREIDRRRNPPARVWTWQRDGSDWRCVEDGRRIEAADWLGLMREAYGMVALSYRRFAFDATRYW